MHNHRTTWSLTGLSLLLLLSIPTFVPALHELLHYHHHLTCNASHSSDVHLHTDIYDCDLCDYLTTFTFLDQRTDRQVDRPGTIARIAEVYTDLYIRTHSGAYHLRGPPVLTHAPTSRA